MKLVNVYTRGLLRGVSIFSLNNWSILDIAHCRDRGSDCIEIAVTVSLDGLMLTFRLFNNLLYVAIFHKGHEELNIFAGLDDEDDAAETAAPKTPHTWVAEGPNFMSWSARKEEAESYIASGHAEVVYALYRNAPFSEDELASLKWAHDNAQMEANATKDIPSLKSLHVLWSSRAATFRAIINRLGGVSADFEML